MSEPRTDDRLLAAIDLDAPQDLREAQLALVKQHLAVRGGRPPAGADGTQSGRGVALSPDRFIFECPNCMVENEDGECPQCSRPTRELKGVTHG